LLFDLKQDPYEQRDLVRAGTHEAVRAELAQKLTQRLQAAGHAAVKTGRLAPQPRENLKPIYRTNGWPGFCSAKVPSDILH
jgi:hypothetical protein